MRVKLTKRTGQNDAGTVVDVSDMEADWLITRGYAEKTGGNGDDNDKGKAPANGPGK